MQSVLLHVGGDCEQQGLLAAAIDIARPFGGEVVCVEADPIVRSEPSPDDGDFGFVGAPLTAGGRAGIAATIDAAGLDHRWRRCDAGVAALIAEAALVDLVIVGQRHRSNRRDTALARLIRYAPAPLLLVPVGGGGCDVTAAAIVAWNGTTEAGHALRRALPLLKLADGVHLVEVGDGRGGTAIADAVAYLARAGIPAERHVWPPKGRAIGVALRHASSELDAGLVVMGAAGYCRHGAPVLGGVTGDMVDNSRVPLLLAS